MQRIRAAKRKNLSDRATEAGGHDFRLVGPALATWLAALAVMVASARLAQDRLGRPRKVA